MADFVPMGLIMTPVSLGSSRHLMTAQPARKKSSALLEESLMTATQATSVLQELILQLLTTDPKLTHAPRDSIAVLECQNRRSVLTACSLSSQALSRSKSASIASQGTTVSMELSKQRHVPSETIAPLEYKSQ
jgi:hypothetical protein